LRRRSREYVQTYEFHLSHGMYALAMFDFEQALQLNVKASLLEEGVAYPRTHSVRRLLELLADVRNDYRLREIIREYAVELRLLEEAYVSSGYVATDFREDEVIRVKRAFDEVMRCVSIWLGMPRRREIFNNLGTYLEKLKEIVLRVDPKAEVYLFGSIAERRHNCSSDVDILVVTEEDKLRILQ